VTDDLEQQRLLYVTTSMILVVMETSDNVEWVNHGRSCCSCMHVALHWLRMGWVTAL